MTEVRTSSPEPVVEIDEFDRTTITLTGAFIEAAMDDATILNGIPNGAVLVLLPEGGDPEFIEKSIELGLAAVRQGRDVVFRHWPVKPEAAEADDPQERG